MENARDVIWQNAARQIDAAMSLARQLVYDGALPGISKIVAARHRHVDGTIQIDLIGQSESEAPDWHFLPSPDENEEQLHCRLLKEHGHWSRACGSFAINAVVKRVRGILASEPTMGLRSWSIATTSHWQEAHPDLVLMISGLGRDTKPGTERLLIHNHHDLDGELHHVVKRHRLALAAVAVWKVHGAIGAIEATAAFIMQRSGADLVDVFAELERSQSVPFKCCDLDLKGAFTWADYRIAVAVWGHPDWRFDGDTLTHFATPLRQSFTAVLKGGPLRALVDLKAMPPDAVIEHIRITKVGDLEVSLRPVQMLFDTQYKLDQPQSWPSC